MFLSLSKIDGFFAKEIIKLINDKVKGHKVEIGRVDLLRNISFVEVAEEDADRVIKALNGQRIKGRNIIVDQADTPSSAPARKAEKASRKAEKGAGGKKKASREERGYTQPRGKKFTKDDWMKFLHPDKK